MTVVVQQLSSIVSITEAGDSAIEIQAPPPSPILEFFGEGPQGAIGPQGPAGPGSADEKVAVVSGGTAGYIWGADGTDGVIRLNSSLSWTKDVGNAYVTIAVDVVDGGAF